MTSLGMLASDRRIDISLAVIIPSRKCVEPAPLNGRVTRRHEPSDGLDQ